MSGGRVPIAVLGATGAVGQRFLQRLAGHPTFRVVSLVASARSAGKRYGDAVKWRLAGRAPEEFRDMVVTDSAQAPSTEVRAALSSLDSSVAGEVETRYAEAGVYVVSNASAHRMDADVPLVVPEVNADHLDLVRHQSFGQGGRSQSGAIVCNPNCSTIGMVLALAPIHARFGLERVWVTTLQAASGAGYPGVSALDLTDNVVPFIPSEEEKLGEEPPKILGRYDAGTIELAKVDVSAQCCRVPVVDGHMASVAMRLSKDASFSELCEAWTAFRGSGPGLQGARAVSAPEHPIRLAEDLDRPQPRLDRDAEGGMAVTVGRVRRCSASGTDDDFHGEHGKGTDSSDPVGLSGAGGRQERGRGWRFVCLSHNTIRGAAGGALLCLEIAHARGDLI